MAESLPIVLVPGLNCSPRLYAHADSGAVALRPGHGRGPHPRRQHGGDRAAHSRRRRRRVSRSPASRWAAMWRSRSCARRRAASPGWRCSTPARATIRRPRRRRAAAASRSPKAGRFAEVIEAMWPVLVHPGPARRRGAQADLSGDVPRRRAGGVRAPAEGDHGARGLASIARRDRLPDAGAGRRAGRTDAAASRRRDGGRHQGRAARQGGGLRASRRRWNGPKP